MNAIDYFENIVEGQGGNKGAVASETDWMLLREINVSGSVLQVGDTNFLGSDAPDETLLVDVEPGEYVIEVRIMEYKGDPRVSRLRARARQVADPELGDAIDTISVDMGQVGVVDYEPLAACLEDEDEETELDYEEFQEELGEECPVGYAQWSKSDPPVVVVYCASGFGDGTYSVYELNNEDKVVGFECEFIEPGAEYPY